MSLICVLLWYPPLWTALCTVFSLIWICLSPFVVIVCAQQTQAALSVYTFVGPGIISLMRLRSDRMIDMIKLFCTFIWSIDFGFGCTAYRDSLAFGGPVNGATKPDEVSQNWVRVDKIKFWLNHSVGWCALVLGTPVGITEWGDGTVVNGELEETLGFIIISAVEG